MRYSSLKLYRFSLKKPYTRNNAPSKCPFCYVFSIGYPAPLKRCLGNVSDKVQAFFIYKRYVSYAGLFVSFVSEDHALENG